MNKRVFVLLMAVFLVLSIFISGCGGMHRIDSFFQNNEYEQHSKLIDFMLFFTIFFALSFLGFSKFFGEGFGKPGTARGAVIGLSFALSLALTFALITQTKFSVTTIFPLAKNILFLVFVLLLYGVLASLLKPETRTGKILIFLLAFMVIYIVLNIFTHFVCQLGDNINDPACRSDFFNAFSKVGYRHFWGPGTIFGDTSGTSSAGKYVGVPVTKVKVNTSKKPGETSGGEGGSNDLSSEDKTSPDEKKPRKNEMASGITRSYWFWGIIIAILLGFLLWIAYKAKRRGKHMKDAEKKIGALLLQLRNLINSERAILEKLQTESGYTADMRAADSAELAAMLNNIPVKPSEKWRKTIKHREYPSEKPIRDFFNEMDPKNPTEFLHFKPLKGPDREALIKNLHQQKLIEADLYWLNLARKRFWMNIKKEIRHVEERLAKMVISPKFNFSDMTVTLMFDARNIKDIDSSKEPAVLFFKPASYANRSLRDNTMKKSKINRVYEFKMAGLPDKTLIKYAYIYFVIGSDEPKYVHDKINLRGVTSKEEIEDKSGKHEIKVTAFRLNYDLPERSPLNNPEPRASA